jgi:hypothetical protein
MFFKIYSPQITLEGKMRLSPEVLASIIKVAGDWALGMASMPNNDNPPQPSQMSGELESDFEWAFKYLSSYIMDYVSTQG